MIHPYKQMIQNATRVSLRRTLHQQWPSKRITKDRRWHRACKRSIKIFMDRSMKLELDDFLKDN